MDSTSSLQFVVLARSATSRACEALVRQALDHTGVFVFGELLDCPNVQALSNTEDGRRLLELVRIFSYGTYPDYLARSAELPELTAVQRRKLQLLTIVSLASRDKRIKFSVIQDALGLPSQPEVEELIVEAIYKGLINAKMDQEMGCLEVVSSNSRDCREEDIDFIINTLSGWHDSANKMTQALDNVAQYNVDAVNQYRLEKEALEKLVKSTGDSSKDGPEGRGGDGGCTRMPQDDADEESKRAKSGRGRWMGGMSGSSRSK